MAQGEDDLGEAGENGVSGLSPARQAELFEPGDENAASPFLAMAIRSTGRPKGSANKRTLAMRDLYLRKGYAHPMLWMGEVLTRPVRELAELLSCDLVEALEIQRKVAADLAPYLESKMPTQVKAPDGEGLPVLIMGEMRVSRRSENRDDGSMAIDDDMADAIQENQRLSARPAQASDGAASDDDAIGERDQ